MFRKMLFSSLLVSGASMATPKATVTVQPFLGNEAGFLVTSNLIVGPKEVMVVDAQFTRSQAGELVKAIQATGKKLTTVFVTHAHPDHYFGIEVLKKTFPKAKYLATPDTIADMQATGPGKIAYWKKIYGEDLTDKVPEVKPFLGKSLKVDGVDVKLVSLGKGESEHATVVYIPSIEALISGDVVFDRVHLWLAEGHPSEWLANLTSLGQLKISKVYPGHSASISEHGSEILSVNSQYIKNFVETVATSKDAATVSTTVKAKYADYKLPVIADIAAQSLKK